MTTVINGVQYNEVKRKAQTGEKIKVVSAFLSMGEYKNGDVLTVQKLSPLGNCVVTAESETWVNHSEYVVLEPVAPADIIVHDGKRYRKVDRPVREGDFILALVDEEDLVKGKAYKVSYVFKDSSIDVIDDVDDAHCLIEGEYHVLEPVETATPSLSTLESELAATKAKVAEMEAHLAAVKKAEAEAQRLNVGDYVKVVDDRKRNGSKRTDVVIGEIRKITENDESSVPFRTTTLDGSDPAWFRAEALTRATDEEVAEAKRKLAFDQFTEGDKVRLMNGGGKFPLHGFQDGNIYEVVTPKYAHSRGAKVQIVDGGGYKGYADPDQIVSVTEEEAKWHAIGREVGQFKNGDVVRLIDNSALAATSLNVGDIGVLYDGDTDGTFRFGARGVTHGNWVKPHRIELIAPVESVVNLRAGDAA